MSRRVCVTNIGFRLTEDDVREYFSRFGQLSDCKLQVDRNSGESRGFAFITFANEEAASKCVFNTSHRIQDKSVTVFYEDQSTSCVPRSKKVFLSCSGIHNFSESIVLQTFQPFGEIASVELVRSKKTDEPIYCVIYFRAHESVDICLSRSHCINGRQVFVRRAVSREEVKLAEQRERELEAAKEQANENEPTSRPTPKLTKLLLVTMPTLICRSERPNNNLLKSPPVSFRAMDTFNCLLCLRFLFLFSLNLGVFREAKALSFVGMSSPLSWRILCEDTVAYESPVDHEGCFNKVIQIWRNQCQSLNRRLIGTSKVDEDSPEMDEILRKLSKDVASIVEGEGKSVEVRKLIARRNCFSLRCYELSFEDNCDSDERAFVFIPLRLDSDISGEVSHVHIENPYRISARVIDETSLRFSVSVPPSMSDEQFKWLRNVAYPGLLRWIQRIDPNKETKPTNRLLSVEKYGDMYSRIKETRGRTIVENWTEKTNPQKYVYEDCGIATYLLQTWSRHGRTPKQFADLGCGNGLLVHLLNEEGVNGYGLDIRSRKIWKSMFVNVDLREAVVDPTAVPSDVIFKGTDYLIGNHSDELTPWIPVMAARLRCEFFVIPCCPFDFHGKYNARPGKHGSSYDGFLQFVLHVAQRLGFVVEEDRMSIPSTKRLCLIGVIPPDGLPPPERIEVIIAELTAERNGVQAKPFAARPKVEEVRNCSKIPRDVQRQLTLKVFDTLLMADDRRIDGWRCGGAVPLSQLISVLTTDERALMKQQDGGFQTFLKNQHQAFHVYGGSCRIRDWREVKNLQKLQPAKRSSCWMLANHPDGCPYGDQCRFSHEETPL